MTGDRKNPARTKKLTRLITSGTLHARGANIKPITHPVKQIKISQTGTSNIWNDSERLCMKKNGIKQESEISAKT